MDTRERIVRALLARPDGMGLTELSRSVGMAGPPVLHHLKRLLAEGAAERFVPEGANRARYRLRPFLSATWIDPATGTFATWSSPRRVDWRYPLVSRLSDTAIQDSVNLFLRLVEEQGLFHVHAAPTPKGRGRKAARGPGPSNVQERMRAYGVRIVAYGSAARGDTGPRSDADLLALTGPALDAKEALLDVAAEANLSAPRRVHLFVFREGDLAKAGNRFADEVRRDGFVIYSSFSGGEYEPILREGTA